jgi:serine/threonine protein kinase
VPSDTQVAVKVFRPQPGNESADALERFRREGQSAQKLQHSNAVKVFDSGVSSDGIAYLVMELLDGRSLKDELAAGGKLSAERAVPIAAQALDALAAAHALSMLHRDVKPDNIFLHREHGREVVKVLDFGMAKLRQAGAVRDKSLTMSGVVVGTPIYMAPERLEDRPYDDRSDVYSMGVVLYEMLVGKPPFDTKEGNLWSLLLQQVSHAPPPPTSLDASVPEEVSAVVLRALAKEPALRPTAASMAEELRAAAPRGAALAR